MIKEKLTYKDLLDAQQNLTQLSNKPNLPVSTALRLGRIQRTIEHTLIDHEIGRMKLVEKYVDLKSEKQDYKSPEAKIKFQKEYTELGQVDVQLAVQPLKLSHFGFKSMEDLDDPEKNQFFVGNDFNKLWFLFPDAEKEFDAPEEEAEKVTHGRPKRTV